MKRILLHLQWIILLGGSVFAWWTVVDDFQYFYAIEGTIFKVTDCEVANPVTTPCFYGAIAFVLALIWAIAIVRMEGERQRKHQHRLWILLIASVLFAWSNMTLEVKRYWDAGGEAHVGCSGRIVGNPVETPCFTGSVIFLGALLVGTWLRDLGKKATASLPDGQQP